MLCITSIINRMVCLLTVNVLRLSFVFVPTFISKDHSFLPQKNGNSTGYFVKFRHSPRQITLTWFFCIRHTLAHLLDHSVYQTTTSCAETAMWDITKVSHTNSCLSVDISKLAHQSTKHTHHSQCCYFINIQVLYKHGGVDLVGLRPNP